MYDNGIPITYCDDIAKGIKLQI